MLKLIRYCEYLHGERAARDAVGAPCVKLYAGTRHRVATKWKAEGVDERVIRSILGYTDERSVQRYARLVAGAMLEVLRPKRKR